MKIEEIIKLNNYAGIDISVEGCIDLMMWSHHEEKKAYIYKRLSVIEYKISKIIKNQMKERHSAIAEGLVDRSEDAIHLSKLLDALTIEWIRKLNEGIKTNE